MTPADGRTTDARDDVCDQAPLYCLGMLRDEELQAFEAHLRGGCPHCAEEVAGGTTAVATLGLVSEQFDPPAGLRDRLLARARGGRPTPATPDGSPPPVSFVRKSEGEWQETDVGGVFSRTIFADPVTDRVTMLMRMDAGTSYPRHRHFGFEECFVLEGDLRVGDVVMHAGDYQRAEADTEHDVHSTEEGCLLLISSGGTEICG